VNIIKKDIDRMTKEHELLLQGRKKGDVFTLQVGAELYPGRLTPQVEIILLDPEENFVAYRARSYPDSLNKRKGHWMLGQPKTVAGVVLEWTEKIIKQKGEEVDLYPSSITGLSTNKTTDLSLVAAKTEENSLVQAIEQTHKTQVMSWCQSAP
jgi:hypothetical protein